MGRQEIRCGVCKSVALGHSEGAYLVEGGRSPALDDKHLCGGCAPLWNRFRVDTDALKAEGAALARDLLTLRGATALALHLKILRTDEREAQKLAGFGADFNEAIKSEATTEELQMLGVAK